MISDQYSKNIYLSTKEGKAEKKYWELQLEGEPAVSCLPRDYMGQTLKENVYQTEVFEVDQELFYKIKKICKGSAYTTYTFLLAGMVFLLHRYTNSSDIMVGMPNFKNESATTTYKNILFMRTVLKEEDTFKDILRKVTKVIKESDQNQSFPFDMAAQLINLPQEDEKYSINTLVMMENIHQLDCEEFIYKDIIFNFILEEECLKVSINYNARYFKSTSIMGFFNRLCLCLLKGISDKEMKIDDLEIVDDKEKLKLLNDFNHEIQDIDENQSIGQLFMEQAKATPDRYSIICNTQKLTYKELDCITNKLAHTLQDKGIGKENIVAILATPSVELIIAILAILKAGAAYLPIDPKYPPNRIKYMIENSGVKLILTNQEDTALEYLIVDVKAEVISLKDEALYSHEEDEFVCQSKKHDLAYLIYTSGSTGKPKAVCVEHKGIINLKQFFKEDLKINAADQVILFASPSFDASVWEIFMTLLNGACLHIVDEEVKNNIAMFEAYINNAKITTMTVPPVYLAQLNPEHIYSLKRVITAGSATSHKLINQWKDVCEYINAYGPTENTICSTFFRCDDSVNSYHSVPIGKPIRGTTAYVLDKNLKLVPCGVIGELCVGGVNLARGYLNNPSLTSEKFIENPYRAGETIYRTGDLVRWLDDGNIEFLGRKDHQVKIRGYRIELGEIEAQLLSIKAIKEAFVTAKILSGTDYTLCAYIVPQEEIDIEYLKKELLKQLPEYMIPTYIVKLQALPLTINGKVNDKALPNPLTLIQDKDDFVAPRTENEIVLAKIWEEILDTKSVGLKSDFFELGGDSIKGIQILTRLNAYELKLDLKDLFKYKLLEDVAKHIGKKSNKSINQESIEGEVALTPIQKWFFGQKLTDAHHWNQAIMLQGKERFNPEGVQEVFKHIIIHHDALRMVYESENNQIKQYNRGADVGGLMSLTTYDLRQSSNLVEEIQQLSNQLQAGIDLQKGPLVKLGLFQTKEADHLLIIIHHLVVDGVSWRIILEDFNKGYQAWQNNENIVFPLKTDAFKTWAEALKKDAYSLKRNKEMKYWQAIEKMHITPLKVDHLLENTRKLKDTQSTEVVLKEETTNKLLTKTHNAFNTEVNDLLLAALGIALKKWSGIDKVKVNLEGHGRENINEEIDITRTVGWFTSQYPVMLDVTDESSLANIICHVKETLRRVPQKGIGYSILKYLVDEDIFECEDKPEVCFNYMGQFEQDVATDLFNLSPIIPGESMSGNSEVAYKLSINAIVKEGKLFTSFAYNTNEYEEATIRDLANGYIHALEAITEYCITRKKNKMTPADVGCSNLSMKEFDMIYSKWHDAIQSIYDLSPTQKGMLFHYIYDKNATTYFQQVIFEINGTLDEACFRESFERIVSRYDILRTRFIYKEISRPVQVVLTEVPTTVHFEDISHMNSREQADYITQYKLADRQKGFDISKSELIRLTILKCEDTKYKLFWSFHHILMDGWCLGILNKEILEIYKSLKYGKALELESPPIYRTYIEWLAAQDENEAKAYWKKYLEGYLNQVSIPKKQYTHISKAYDRQEVLFTLERSKVDILKRLAKDNKTTLNITFQAIWSILLQKYNHTEDVVFGSVMSGRFPGIPGIEKMLGLFINIVPVRVNKKKEANFVDLLESLQEDSLMAEKYSYYPLVEIQEVSSLKRELIDHILVFENYPIEKSRLNSDAALGFTITGEEAFQQTNYNLSLTIFPGDEMGIKAVFNGEVYDKAFIKNIKSHIEAIIDAVSNQPQKMLKDILIVNQPEFNKVIGEFNHTDTSIHTESTIIELFEQRVDQVPNHKAVIYGDAYLTYEALDQRANQLAHTLKKNYIATGDIVALIMKPSLEMIIGMIGILKVGAAYLPIDASVPVNRMKHILEDSGAKLVLTDNDILREEFNTLSFNLKHANTYSLEQTRLNLDYQSDNLVYVIYTSGTTGTPKGVLIANDSLVNYVQWFTNFARITDEDKTVLLSSFAFDLGYTSLYSSLLMGAQLHLLEREQYIQPKKLMKYIKEQHITYFKATPSLLGILVNEQEQIQCNNDLRLIVLGGEKINVDDLEKLHHIMPQVKVMNHYGPTETTIGVVACQIDFEEIEQFKARPVIGKTIANTQVYVLDEQLMPTPIGVPGELFISGAAVGKGYLKHGAYEREKFISNPFSKQESLMYRSGDIGRFLPNGMIEFLDRNSSMVKIRGYRVDTKEVEKALVNKSYIKEAYVTSYNENNEIPYLCAYVVMESSVTQGEIKEALGQELPEYMVPSVIISIESMPLMGNGKVDVKALPKINQLEIMDIPYEAPRNEVEGIVHEIWQDVLGLERIGIDYNFFDMGGHSLKLINMIAKIFERFDVELSPVQVSKMPTIRNISKLLIDGEYEEPSPLSLLNSESDKKVFLFPPVGGYGLVYKTMADNLEDYAFYSFNYIEHTAENLQAYIDYIKSIQEVGPYILMGWSAGGNLAFEVAKQLERQGDCVADIILVDVYKVNSLSNLSPDKIKEMVHQNITLAAEDDFYKQYLSKSEFIKQKVMGKMEDFMTYLRNHMVNLGTISGNIHMLLSTDPLQTDKDPRMQWETATMKTFEVKQGIGSHSYMLYEGCIEENAKIINSVLKQCFKSKLM